MLTQYQLAALQMAHPSDATIFCAIYSLPRQGKWKKLFSLYPVHPNRVDLVLSAPLVRNPDYKQDGYSFCKQKAKGVS